MAFVARLRRKVFPDGAVEVCARLFGDTSDDDGRVPGYRPKIPGEVASEAQAELYRQQAERRAKQGVREAVECIEADRLLTLTFRENVTDLREAREVFRRFVSRVREAIPGWQYVAVPERQERGAVHFHCAVKGYQRVELLRALWLAVARSRGGNIDVTKPRGGGRAYRWSVASYIAKYIGKSFEWIPKGSRRFTASEDRARPVVQRWWIEYGTTAEVIEQCYRSAAGERAEDVRQWLARDASVYWVRSCWPPKCDCPF